MTAARLRLAQRLLGEQRADEAAMVLRGLSGENDPATAAGIAALALAQGRPADAAGMARAVLASGPLPAPLLVSAATTLAGCGDPGPADASVGTVLVEMFQDGAGRFLGAGQANQLRLPCSEAAFRRVAYTA